MTHIVMLSLDPLVLPCSDPGQTRLHVDVDEEGYGVLNTVMYIHYNVMCL